MARKTGRTKKVGQLSVDEYTIERGDTLQKIVRQAGFAAKSWKAFYNAPYNSDFKAQLRREDRSPDLIYAGEIFWMPTYKRADFVRAAAILDQITGHLRALSRLQKTLATAIRRLQKDLALSERDFLNQIRPLEADLRSAERLLDECYNSAESMDNPYALGAASAICQSSLKPDVTRATTALGRVRTAARLDKKGRERAISGLQSLFRSYDSQVTRASKRFATQLAIFHKMGRLYTE